MNSKNKKKPLLINIAMILGSIAVALLLGAIFLLFQGESPIEIYYYLLIEPLISISGIIKVLGKATPLIFTGLAVAISFKCGLFNIGVEGQLLFGALATAVVGYFGQGLSPIVHVIVSILAGVIAGALYALLPALLKVKLNVHEVISTIMLNNIASALTAYIIVNHFRDKSPTARTYYVAESARLSQYSAPEHLNSGFIIALFCVMVMYIIMNRTPLGWKIDSAGKNMMSSRYSGINAEKVILLTMLVSGGMAGLCGIERVLGAYGYMAVDFSPGYGFDGITIAVIGKNNPLGVLIAALFIGLLQYGGVNINMMTKVPYEWVQALIAIIFILVAAQDKILKKFAGRIKKSSKKVDI